jgi:ABC-type nitrate/sulfonate/bicarbonate transport system substrate-binding protein
LPDFCLAVSRERLNKDKDFIANFLKATFEATVEATKKPEEAAAAAVQLNPLLDKTATLKQWLLMRDYFYTDSTKNCPHGWHSPEDWKKALVTLKQYANLQGDTDNLDKFFTNQFFSCSR